MKRSSPSNLPRISVNKLAEFMTVKASRQRQILRDQKFPSDFKGPYYKEAAEAIGSCIASNLENIDALNRQLRILEQQSPDKIGTQRRIASNIDAIETFQLMLDDIDMKGASPSLGANSAPTIKIQNVEISVRPEILLKSDGKRAPLVGAMKLHFPRTFSLNEEAAGYISALLQEWSKTYQPDTQTHGPLCCVIDVGSKKMYPGVKSTVQRLKDIEAACQNVFALWPSITPSPE